MSRWKISLRASRKPFVSLNWPWRRRRRHNKVLAKRRTYDYLFVFFFFRDRSLFKEHTCVKPPSLWRGGGWGGALHNTSEHGKCEWTRWRALATTSPAGNKRLEAGSSSLVIYRTSCSIFSPSEKLSGRRQGTRKTGKKEGRIERGTDTIFTKDYFPLFWKQMLGRVFQFLWSYWSAKKKKKGC